MLTLGLNFMENYYVVFDIENSQIGLVDSVYSKNDDSLEQSLYESTLSQTLLLMQEMQEKTAEYKEPLMIMGVFAAFTATFVAAAKCMEQKKRTKKIGGEYAALV